MKKLILILLVLAVTIVAALFLREGDSVPEKESFEVQEMAVDPLVVTLFEDVEVVGGGSSLLQSGDARENRKVFDGIEFTLTPSPDPLVVGEALLTFNLRIDGKPATDMQTHLGVYGSSVAINKDTLETVPVSIVRRVTPHGTLEFRTVFLKSGEYLVLTQFKRAGNIVTTDFTVSVR